jgi:hypothetical protein
MLKNFLQDETGADWPSRPSPSLCSWQSPSSSTTCLAKHQRVKQRIRRNHQEREVQLRRAHAHGSQLAFSWLPSFILILSKGQKVMNLQREISEPG